MARRKKRLKLSTRLQRAHRRVMARTKPGTGKRFASLKAKLAKKGARNPAALAAWIGRRKYGKKRMAKMAAQGRKRRGRRGDGVLGYKSLGGF